MNSRFPLALTFCLLTVALVANAPWIRAEENRPFVQGVIRAVQPLAYNMGRILVRSNDTGQSFIVVVDDETHIFEVVMCTPHIQGFQDLQVGREVLVEYTDGWGPIPLPGTIHATTIQLLTTILPYPRKASTTDRADMLVLSKLSARHIEEARKTIVLSESLLNPNDPLQGLVMGSVASYLVQAERFGGQVTGSAALSQEAKATLARLGEIAKRINRHIYQVGGQHPAFGVLVHRWEMTRGILRRIEKAVTEEER